MDVPGYSDHEKDRFLAQRKRKGIRDRTVLEAMATVPREQFVGLDLAEFAYDDAPLPSDERHQRLAHQASTRLKALGNDNVEVLCGDGTLGWPEHAPYDAIVVAAGAPEAPRSLIEQLVIGGRLVIPAGPTLAQQSLLRITRVGEDEVETEELGAVRFVPLIGEEGWPAVEETLPSRPKPGKVHEPEPIADCMCCMWVSLHPDQHWRVL